MYVLENISDRKPNLGHTGRLYDKQAGDHGDMPSKPSAGVNQAPGGAEYGAFKTNGVIAPKVRLRAFSAHIL